MSSLSLSDIEFYQSTIYNLDRSYRDLTEKGLSYNVFEVILPPIIAPSSHGGRPAKL